MAHAYERVAEPEVVASLAFGADDSAAVDGDVVAEPVIAGTVPFYKRELGFRRKKAGAVEAVAFAATDIDLTDDEVDLREPAAEPELVAQNIELDPVEEIVEPVAAATVPFYKRDLSFRRKKTVAEEATVVVAADALLETSGDTAEFAAHADEPVVAWARSDEQAEETNVVAEDGAVEEAPVELTWPEPAAAIVAVHDVEPDTTDETPASEAVVEVEDVPEGRPVVAEVVEVVVAASAVSHFAEADAPESPVVDEHEVVELEHELVAVAEVDADLDFSLTDDVPTGDVPNEDLPTDEVEGTDAVDTPAEETPDRGGRFGTRKQKAPKQKRSGGAKRRKIVGLKIGASQIAAAVVSETEAGHELLQLARRSLAAGIVVDGEVRDEAALAGAVKASSTRRSSPRPTFTSACRATGSASARWTSTASRMRAASTTRCDSRLTRCSRLRSPSPCSTTASSRSASARTARRRGGCCSSSLPATRSSRISASRARPASSSSAIDLEALGLLRAFVEPGTGVPRPTTRPPS